MSETKKQLKTPIDRKQGHRQRLKERFEKNPHDLQDYEFLELLLTYAIPRKDTKNIAKDLLHENTFRSALHLSQEQIGNIENAGKGVAFFFQVLQECMFRYKQSEVQEAKEILSLKDYADLAYIKLAKAREEELWIAALNSSNKLISFEKIVQGSLSSLEVSTRSIAERAMNLKASGIILFHNHPGGNSSPSSSDLEFTTEVAKIIEGLGIRLLDHLIVTEKEVFCIYYKRKYTF